MFSLYSQTRGSQNHLTKWETKCFWVIPKLQKHPLFDNRYSGELEDGMTPPKQSYKHDVTIVFGIWMCNRCKAESRSIDKLQSVPCNAALVKKFMEIEAHSHLVIFLGGLWDSSTCPTCHFNFYPNPSQLDVQGKSQSCPAKDASDLSASSTEGRARAGEGKKTAGLCRRCLGWEASLPLASAGDGVEFASSQGVVGGYLSINLYIYISPGNRLKFLNIKLVSTHISHHHHHHHHHHQ